jgi:hypothetical protein
MKNKKYQYHRGALFGFRIRFGVQGKIKIFTRIDQTYRRLIEARRSSRQGSHPRSANVSVTVTPEETTPEENADLHPLETMETDQFPETNPVAPFLWHIHGCTPGEEEPTNLLMSLYNRRSKDIPSDTDSN